MQDRVIMQPGKPGRFCQGLQAGTTGNVSVRRLSAQSVLAAPGLPIKEDLPLYVTSNRRRRLYSAGPYESNGYGKWIWLQPSLRASVDRAAYPYSR